VAIQVPGGSITSRGLELEGHWYPTDNLAIDFGATIEDSNYDEFIVGAGNLVWNGVCPIGSDEIAGSCVYIMDDKPTAYSPDFTLSTGISYNIDMGRMGTLTPYVLAYFNDGYATNRAPVFFGVQDSFTKINASLNWVSQGGQFNAKLWVNNATDELIQTYTEIFSRARVGYDYQNPRMWGVRFGYNF
jgi:iron complex outermembrane receptor protein